LEVDRRDAPDEGPLDLKNYAGREGERTLVSDVKLTDHLTQPPPHISESELLELMDRHGIGTDASMAQDVSNVQKRSYVVLDESTRRMAPSALGLALAHGYALVDFSLLLPSVRARIENECSRVAQGLVGKDAVIRRTIRIFKKKMYNFASRIDRLPLMLAVAFAQERGGGQVAGDALANSKAEAYGDLLGATPHRKEQHRNG
jgi:DNA topoisomerase III